MEDYEIILMPKTYNLKPRIIFIGTPEFGAIALEKLIKGGYPPVLVITSPDKPIGRKQILTPSPVKQTAQKYNILILQPDRIRNLELEIRNSKPDLGIVAAYAQIIPKGILGIPKYGFLNVHPSLLPECRGPSPIQFAILNGEKKSGVTIILMDEKIDHGKIISNFRFPISNKKITYPELSKELAELGAKLLIETIPKWIRGEIKPKPQNEAKATYTKIIKKEDGKIDWKKPAEVLEKQIRAFYPWPGSFTFWEKREESLKIEILKARVLKEDKSSSFPSAFAREHDFQKYEIGKTLAAPQNHLCIQTGKEFLIVERLQMEGRKEMDSEDFIRGYADFIGTVLK